MKCKNLVSIPHRFSNDTLSLLAFASTSFILTCSFSSNIFFSCTFSMDFLENTPRNMCVCPHNNQRNYDYCWTNWDFLMKLVNIRCRRCICFSTVCMRAKRCIDQEKIDKEINNLIWTYIWYPSKVWTSFKFRILCWKATAFPIS